MPFLPPNQQRQSTEGIGVAWLGIRNVWDLIRWTCLVKLQTSVCDMTAGISWYWQSWVLVAFVSLENLYSIGWERGIYVYIYGHRKCSVESVHVVSHHTDSLSNYKIIIRPRHVHSIWVRCRLLSPLYFVLSVCVYWSHLWATLR